MSFYKHIGHTHGQSLALEKKLTQIFDIQHCGHQRLFLWIIVSSSDVTYSGLSFDVGFMSAKDIQVSCQQVPERQQTKMENQPEF